MVSIGSFTPFPKRIGQISPMRDTSRQCPMQHDRSPNTCFEYSTVDHGQHIARDNAPPSFPFAASRLFDRCLLHTAIDKTRHMHRRRRLRNASGSMPAQPSRPIRRESASSPRPLSSRPTACIRTGLASPGMNTTCASNPNPSARHPAFCSGFLPTLHENPVVLSVPQKPPALSPTCRLLHISPGIFEIREQTFSLSYAYISIKIAPPREWFESEQRRELNPAVMLHIFTKRQLLKKYT